MNVNEKEGPHAYVKPALVPIVLLAVIVWGRYLGGLHREGRDSGYKGIASPGLCSVVAIIIDMRRFGDMFSLRDVRLC